MAAKQNQPYRSSRSGGPKQFDIVAPKGKQPEFPAVGKTLNTYQSQSRAPRKPVADSVFLPAEKHEGFFSRLRHRIPFKRIALVLVTLILLVGGYLGIKFIYNAHKLFGNSVFSALGGGKLDGESSGRVNILLAGNSADDPGHQGGNLTDSILILSVDTKHNTAFMISVPRDLYVENGDGHSKINAVYPAGQNDNFSEDGYFDGGMGQLQKTIQDDIGIKCQYYALVNYNALKDAVNAVGGIQYTVKSSDPRGLYDPSRDYSAPKAILVKLTNGVHTLNGQQALNLARARGDAPGSYGFPNSDFDRTAHQREIILDIRSKATSAGVLTNPIRLGSLFDSVGSNVKTNMTLANVKRLYEITKPIGGNNIQSVGLNNANGVNLLKGQRINGADVLVPAAGADDYSEIQKYVQRLMSNDLVVREGASVQLLNGTPKNGLAAFEQERLEAKNITVAGLNDADKEDYTVTQIIDLSGGKMPATLKVLQTSYPGATTTTTNPFAAKYKANFIVILGTDRQQADAGAMASER